MRPLRQMIWLLAALAALSGCAKGPRLIPEKKLTAIYADFYINDQWFIQNHKERTRADSSLVYEPVLNRYGYTTDDYIYTVEQYMADPERFSKLVKASRLYIEKERERLGIVREELRKREEHFRHEPWKTVDFDKIDYLSLPLIPSGMQQKGKGVLRK